MYWVYRVLQVSVASISAKTSPTVPVQLATVDIPSITSLLDLYHPGCISKRGDSWIRRLCQLRGSNIDGALVGQFPLKELISDRIYGE